MSCNLHGEAWLCVFIKIMLSLYAIVSRASKHLRSPFIYHRLLLLSYLFKYARSCVTCLQVRARREKNIFKVRLFRATRRKKIIIEETSETNVFKAVGTNCICTIIRMLRSYIAANAQRICSHLCSIYSTYLRIKIIRISFDNLQYVDLSDKLSSLLLLAFFYIRIKYLSSIEVWS